MGGVDWIHAVHDNEMLRAFLQIPHNLANFFNNCGTIGFLGRVLLHRLN